MQLPATFARSQVIAAFDALGLTGPDAEAEIAGLRIVAEQIDVDLFVHEDPDDHDSGVITGHGEFATVTITVPVDEAT